jgi:site-specific recombinase XerD
VFFKATDNIPRWRNGDAFAPSVAPVLFRLMYTCGLRPTEVRMLKLADVNLNTGEVLITKNKTHKERIVVMSDDMAALCKAYENRRHEFFVRSNYYFPRVDGTAYTNQQLTALCKRCWRFAKPDLSHRSCQPQAIRPAAPICISVLQQWLDEGRDLLTMLPYLRTYMGHEHIEDTAYYIHILPERLIRSPGIDWANLIRVCRRSPYGRLNSNRFFELVRDYFKVYLPNVKKYSHNTLRSYQKSMELLLDYVKDTRGIRFHEITFDMIDEDVLLTFLDYVEDERGCSVTTRNHRLHCIRSFYQYAADSDITVTAYWDDIKKVKPRKRAPHLWSI